MAMEIDQLAPAALEVRIDGVLQQNDYERFVPDAERRIREQGYINLLVDVSDLEGATPTALWEDLKFDAKHFSDVKRVAIIGRNDSKKQDWLAKLARPFTKAEVAFYVARDLPAVRAWVAEESGETKNS